MNTTHLASRTAPTHLRRMTTRREQPTTTTTRTAVKIELDVRVERPDGVWATLRFDPSGGYVPGLGPIGTYYAEHWAPYFPEGMTPPLLRPNRDRARVERSMRNWLKNAPSQ